MKKFFFAGALSLCAATTGTVNATTPSTVPIITITNIPSAVTVPAIGIGAALLIGEAICTADKKHSCTKGLEQAGQDFTDYLRGKKNGFKALERFSKRAFGW